MLAPSSANAWFKGKLPRRQGIVKRPESPNFWLFCTTAEHCSLSETLETSSIFFLLERRSFRNLPYFGMRWRVSISGRLTLSCLNMSRSSGPFLLLLCLLGRHLNYFLLIHAILASISENRALQSIFLTSSGDRMLYVLEYEASSTTSFFSTLLTDTVITEALELEDGPLCRSFKL
ncbi:hypothetical protein L1987_23776 [Smallanthus sonchifolius]|uniref:Uncharacterized protein n=1 Tax=Smallanthus sonchifolius TaxID=185202 RepID=A0ACB9IK30_9ASTR|nr:hypothetical protein L1987_23776 [Smallanthus sonchifolius]